MPKRLHVEMIDTVGFVDTGANPLADVLIWKRLAEAEEEPMTDTEGGKFASLLRAVGKTLKWSDTDVEAAVTEAATIKQEVGKMSDGFDRTTLPEEAQEAFADLEGRATAAEAAQAEVEQKLTDALAKSDPDASDKDVLKGIPEAVLKRLEDAEQRAVAAEDIAKAERDLRQRSEYVKLADELPNLPGDDKVDVLAAIHNLPDADRDTVLGMLRSANAVADEAELFKAAGREGDGTGNGDVYDQISAKANTLVEKGDKSTFEQAFDFVMQNDRELAKAYRDERNRR